MRLASILLVWGQLLVPGFLFLQFVNAGFASLLELLLSAGVLLSFCGLMFLIGRWDWFGTWLRFVLLVVPVAIVLLVTGQFRHLPWTTESVGAVTVTTNVFIIAVFTAMMGRALAGRRHREVQQLEIAFPLANATFYIAHGGSNVLINHHAGHQTQKYALDIVKLGPLGIRALGFYPKQLERYAIFGESVLSPINATVLVAVDGIPDLQPPQLDAVHRAGNYIVLKPDERPNLYVLLAHLRLGSIKVHAGEVVRQGRVIAEVGNSGNSTEPHLHIHCASLAVGDGDGLNKYLSGGTGVPLIINGRFYVRNNVVYSRQLQRIEAGQLAAATATA